ncbi:class I SAM-dependent methyltransferase [Pelagibius sp.]|uniref:class I SAM-dependent methyltransferase n=1 Tax=Pelagibius sp. TaxID=1931238 RepID=UPI003B5030EF
MTAAVSSPQATPCDPARQEAFEGRMLTALNEACLMLMTSIGHRSGLFDALNGAAPMTVEDLATRAGLQQRYVREWLGAMVAGGIVEIDPEAATYSLPAEHAALLTRSGEANLAVYAQYVPLLGSVEEDLLTCFRDGGGVPYERYRRFHEVMAEDSGQAVLPALISDILPLVPDLIARLESGIRVLDAGCGRGRALMLMAERFPRSRFTGFDLSEEATAWARDAAKRKGLTNVTYEARDLRDFDATAPQAAFDLVTTFDAVHDQAQPLRLLKGIRRALADDGVYLAQDIKGSSHHHLDRDHPLGPMLYTVSCMHCMTVSLAQGGEGLGAMWGRETAERYFAEAGFGAVETHELDHDPVNYYYVCRP